MGARYSRQSGYTISKRRTQSRQTVRTVPQKVGFGPTTAKYIGLAILAIIAIVVATQSSTRATSAYQENDLRGKLSQVNGDVDSLKLEAKRAQALNNVQAVATKDNMEPDQDVTYVPETGQVAGVSTAAPTKVP